MIFSYFSFTGFLKMGHWNKCPLSSPLTSPCTTTGMGTGISIFLLQFRIPFVLDDNETKAISKGVNRRNETPISPYTHCRLMLPHAWGFTFSLNFMSIAIATELWMEWYLLAPFMLFLNPNMAIWFTNVFIEPEMNKDIRLIYKKIGPTNSRGNATMSSC